MFRNLPPALGYNGSIRPLDVLGTWRNFDGKRYHPESLLAFGWGDGAGGPTAKMLENFARLKTFPALPRLRMARVEDYFAALPRRGLPRWVGELYLEFHRGTFTTQAKVKALNRAAEHRLLEAEAFATLAHRQGLAYPRVALESAWKTLLLNQFHDILPGSSIAEVYQDTHRDLAEVVAVATAARDEALRHLGTQVGGPPVDCRVLVANTAITPRPLTVMLPDVAADAILTEDGEPLPTQPTAGGLLVHDRRRSVPALGWTTLSVAPPAERDGAPPANLPRVSAIAQDGGAVIENDNLRLVVGSDGTLTDVFDKSAERQVLAGRGNQLWAYVDKPRTYDAWDIEESYEDEGDEIGDVQSVTVIEGGPLRSAVRVARAWRNSRIEQTYRLLAASRQLDIETYIDWHERQMLLKARFPLAVRTHEATYETMYGAVRRPTHRNTTWDAARFEVCAHRFADLSEPGYGIALLNNGKYGHSTHDNVLSLSLVRGPLYPDPFADEGEHRFTYSLLPHTGDWAEAAIVEAAFALNSPLVALQIAGVGGDQPARDGLVAIEGVPLALGCLKRADDGRGDILRVYEPHGARGTATLRFVRALSRVETVNLLEQPVPTEASAIALAGDTVRLTIQPFQVMTLRIE
jgi:alpha-mannosidase